MEVKDKIIIYTLLIIFGENFSKKIKRVDENFVILEICWKFFRTKIEEVRICVDN